MSYKLLKIRPKIDFSTEMNVKSLCGLDELGISSLALFRLPLLVAIIDPNGQINWDITYYLSEEAFWSHSTQGDTVRSYAESIISWLNFLESHQLSLHQATEVDLQTYRNELCDPNISPIGRYSSQTINLRIKSITRYYSWAEFNKNFSSPLGRWVNDGPSNLCSLIGLVSCKARQRSLIPKLEKRLPKILTKEELAMIFNLTPKPYSLMFKWAVVTGMRRFELCNLKIPNLPNLNPYKISDSSLEEISITRKGGREISVMVPIRLIEETRWYLLTERSEALLGDENFLFIGHFGRRVSKQHLSKVFRGVADKIGSQATLHHLRHTFAVYTLCLLQKRAKNGDSINPLKTLQILMGHACIESTEIYLRALDIQNEAVEEALDFLYGATI